MASPQDKVEIGERAAKPCGPCFHPQIRLSYRDADGMFVAVVGPTAIDWVGGCAVVPPAVVQCNVTSTTPFPHGRPRAVAVSTAAGGSLWVATAAELRRVDLNQRAVDPLPTLTGAMRAVATDGRLRVACATELMIRHSVDGGATWGPRFVSSPGQVGYPVVGTLLDKPATALAYTHVGSGELWVANRASVSLVVDEASVGP